MTRARETIRMTYLVGKPWPPPLGHQSALPKIDDSWPGLDEQLHECGLANWFLQRPYPTGWLEEARELVEILEPMPHTSSSVSTSRLWSRAGSFIINEP